MAKTKIYMDYAASTPVDERAVRAMLPYFTRHYGNTASLHDEGATAAAALEASRASLAGMINAQTREIVFTGSATESNNLALKGVALANRARGNHLLVSSIEHDCVLGSAEWLKGQGFEVELIPVDRYGRIDPETVEAMIRPETLLVSVMHANNEMGTIEPIARIGKACRRHGAYFHTDAAQTFGKLPIDVEKMSIDLLTASSQKIYGPKGAALLYVRSGVRIEPLLHGGGHEHGLRSSTVNVPAIVGFAEAARLCQAEMDEEAERLSKLRDKLIDGIRQGIGGVHLNGHPRKRLPNNANLRFDGIEGESILMLLNARGIYAATGSACSSQNLKPSHVLLSMGIAPQEVHGSLRLSLGRWTTEADIDYVLEVLPAVIGRLREISPLN